MNKVCNKHFSKATNGIFFAELMPLSVHSMVIFCKLILYFLSTNDYDLRNIQIRVASPANPTRKRLLNNKHTTQTNERMAELLFRY